jgi:hypothetical protein
LASAKEIPPGGEGQVSVKFKTTNKKGEAKQRVTVTSNDPVNPTMTLELKAFLEVYFTAEPNRVYFGRVGRKEPVVKPIVFSGKEIANINIKEISIKPNDPPTDAAPAFSWQLKDNRKQSPEGGLELELTLDTSKMKPDRFRETLVITTDNAKVPSLEISLSGEILGPLTANPPRLYFGNYDSDQEMARSVTIESTEGNEFTIKDATLDESNLKITKLDRKAKGTTHEIEVTLLKGYPNDRFRAELTIQTDVADHPQISVPINGYKRRDRNSPDTGQKLPFDPSQKVPLKPGFGKSMNPDAGQEHVTKEVPTKK